MPQYLKTMGTCMACAAEVPLRRLKDAGLVRCARCAETHRLLRQATYLDLKGHQEREIAPGAAGAYGVAHYLRAAAARLEAAACVLEAQAGTMSGLQPYVQRQWAAFALGRAQWGARMAANALPLVERTQQGMPHNLLLVPGERQTIYGRESDLPPAPALRVVKETT